MALIIGNDAYQEIDPLSKAGNDARAMAALLERRGFDVTLLIDRDRRSMNRALSEFGNRLTGESTAFLFFAGHGVEIDGANYLLPVDMPKVGPGDERFVAGEGIALGEILAVMNRARAAIVVLDACRDNPFEQAQGRSLGGQQGLRRPQIEPRGTFIVYSAGVHQTALDDLGPDDDTPNSVFTRVFLEELEQPEISIRDAVVATRNRVAELASSIGADQFPSYYDQLTADLYIDPVLGSVQTVESDEAIETREAEAEASVATEGEPTFQTFETLTQTPEASPPSRDQPLRPRPAEETADVREEEADLALADPHSRPDLVERGLPVESEPTPAPVPEPTVTGAAGEQLLGLDRSERREIQWQLNALGYSAGGADGIFGKRTRAAVRQYQTDVGLPADGYVDARTRNALERDGAEPARAMRAAEAARKPKRQTRTHLPQPGSSGMAGASVGDVLQMLEGLGN
ncbi:MAG: caspase family protein [Pseudomonadota bacterium]